MGDLQKGYTFSGTSPNNSVTAEKLNTLVDGATIQTSFYTTKQENLAADDADLLLLYEPASGSFRKITKGRLVTSGIAKSGFSNLAIYVNTASEMQVTADEVVMRSTNGSLRYASGLACSVNMANYNNAPTPNGRDFATEAQNTWYYVWAISDGTNDRALLSASALSPNLPSGFTYRKLLGVVRNNANADFVRFSQRNCDVEMAVASAAGTTSPQLNPYTGGVEFTDAGPTTARVFQTVDLSRCVPPNLTGRVRGLIGSSLVGTTAHQTYVLAARGSGYLTGVPTDPNQGLPTFAWGMQMVQAMATSATKLHGFNNVASFEVGLYASQQLDWASTTTAAVHNLRVTGFSLNL